MSKRINNQAGYRMIVIRLILLFGAFSFRAFEIIDALFSADNLHQVIGKMTKGKKDEKKPILTRYYSEETKRHYVNLSDYPDIKESYSELIAESVFKRYEDYIREDIKNRTTSEGIARKSHAIRASEAELILSIAFVLCASDKNDQISYYPSKMIKRSRSENIAEYPGGVKENVETHSNPASKNNSRLIGLMKCYHRYYALYNACDNFFYFSDGGEASMKRRLDMYTQHSIGDGKALKTTSIIFTYDYMKIVEYLNPDESKSKLFNFEDIYKDGVYVLPYDSNGLICLQILMQKNWKKELTKHLITRKGIDVMEKSQPYDGINEDGTEFYYNLCDCNIIHLRGVKTHITPESKNSKKHTIICYYFQIPALLEFIDFNENIVINPVKPEKALGFFGLNAVKLDNYESVIDKIERFIV